MLRLRVYQLVFLSRVPEYANLNEMVDLEKDRKGNAKAKFATAILRRVLREKRTVAGWIDQLKRDQPAVGYSHPTWLMERWRQRFSSDDLTFLLEWNDRALEVYARLNELWSSVEPFADVWSREGVEYQSCELPWPSPARVFSIHNNSGAIVREESFGNGGYYI
ncbi:MAG: Ribosomal RNA small subunit methyltransferase B [Verrucomicrobia subdivision 3 bacterium]|nr:Ribosomal RNA small subunit methyltransferase B [Limisphaerales bacterium]MCS1412324.1 Ribosomal RNA small subunit methyltransferase B [Limisphaerales bacterium]